MATATTTVTAVIAARITKQEALARSAATALAKLWRRIDTRMLFMSWQAVLHQALAVVSAAQLASARTADDYVYAAMVAQHLDPKDYGRLNPRLFVGVAADGRRLDTLLNLPIITALQSIKEGRSVQQALGLGAVQLDMIARTEIADAARLATQVSMTARGAGWYVRVIMPGACARCAILAGRLYRWNTGFERHPRCRCENVPTDQVEGRGLITDPMAYFGGLSTQEQDRLFTIAGAQAIRDGADLNQVVNARLGLYRAGGRSLTRSAARLRGVNGMRLTTEQIYREAKGSRVEALRLLKRFGYVI